MFKIESYVTPILLSYVDKYVRDFKPADAQVSLWGGGVVLHNLVLKADVLQHEVALPFTLVSGRIHELLIQVPWTKIMSEPIVVTIDTIECVLSLHPPAASEEPLPTETPRSTVVETPPGYMQALVRRIVSNISLRVHHLIVKYVQDDIVLSLNVKHLCVESAGADWAPAFADIDQTQPVVRRLVRLDDLTLCLDRADSDGKIRFYQEPLLYRCQLDLRVLTRLVSANTRRASCLTVQLRSSKLAWGVTSEQLTLLLRLLRERGQIQVKTPPPQAKQNTLNTVIPQGSTTSNIAEPERTESWSEWAWSWLPTWMEKEGGVEEATMPPTPIPVYFTAYLDYVSLVFKVMESESNARKRPRGVLELCATHAAAKASVCSPTMLRMRVGARGIKLLSRGKCVCGQQDINAINDESTIYLEKRNGEDLELWSWPENIGNVECKIDIAEAAEEAYNVKLDLSNEATQATPISVPTPPPEGPESKDEELWQLLAPVIFLDYSHVRSPPHATTNPYDRPPLDFEYSDWQEENKLQICLEPLDIFLGMGLIHRLSTIRAIFHELPSIPVPDLPMRTLTVEECEALEENIPQRQTIFIIRGLRLRVLPWDHSLTEKQTPAMLALDIESPEARFIISGPLYPHRVCSAACQMPKDNGLLWQGARLHVSATLGALEARLCSLSDGQSRPVARADIRFVLHLLLHPEMFPNKATVHTSYNIKIREINTCGSSARLQAAWQILQSLFRQQLSLALRYTTLPKDALSDEESVAIDATIEDASLRGFITRTVNTHIAMVNSARVMALYSPTDGDVKQAWIFSAPDNQTTTAFFRVAVQWCDEEIDNCLDYVGVWSEPMAVCVDPLFMAWLAYKPLSKISSSDAALMSRSSSQSQIRRRVTPPSSSGRGASRTGSGSELVHAVRLRSLESSSEPGEPRRSVQPLPVKKAENFLHPDRLLSLYKRLQELLVCVELGAVVVYITTATASAEGCAAMRDAVERLATGTAKNQVLVFSIGKVSLSSNSIMSHLWADVRHDGPSFIEKPQVPESQEPVESFPWKLGLADLTCYTLEGPTESPPPTIYETGRVKGCLRTNLKPSAINTRLVLEAVTTTVTLSIVTKYLQIRTWKMSPDQRKSKDRAELTPEELRLKYFTSGTDFRPSTLKEFVRGPSRRPKTQNPEKVPNANIVREPQEKTTKGPVVSIGVHLHADTPPITVRLEKDQVNIIAAAVHCLKHLHMILNRTAVAPARQSYTPLSGSHRSLIRSVSEVNEQNTPSEENMSESFSELVPIFESRAIPEVKLKTFFWFQWVVGRATLVIASQQSKLAMEVDDIISTVDIQEHYNQLKVKVASASLRHHKKSVDGEWEAGVLGGRVLEAREPTDSKEENHFLSVTITQAQISNLPTSWKEELHPKLLQQKEADSMWEIYATLAPLEAVLHPDLIENMLSLAHEMAPPSFCPLQSENEQRVIRAWQWPFCYISAGGLRLLINTELQDGDNDDTFLLLVGRVSVNPHPENPICRRPVAAVIDGSWSSNTGNPEGRQYEIDIKHIAIQSAQFKQILIQEARAAGTGGENPAVKWTLPPVSQIVTPILHNVDVSCILAPALFINGMLSCGPAVELNLASDCTVELSLQQLHLIKRLLSNTTATPELSEESISSLDNLGVCPYAALLLSPKTQPDTKPQVGNTPYVEDPGTQLYDDSTRQDRSFAADSGIDISMWKTRLTTSTSKKNVSVMFAEETIDASEYLEVFVTMGVIQLSLYTEDDESEETIELRPPNRPQQTEEATASPEKPVNPLVTERSESQLSNSRVSLNEGYRDVEHGATHLDLLVSLFNAWIGLGAGQATDLWSRPLFSTAKGVADPVTDIPPALATVKIVLPTGGYASTSYSSTKGTVTVDVERPVQLEVSADSLRRLNLIGHVVQKQLQKGSSKKDYARPHIDEDPQSPAFLTLRKFMVNNTLESIIIQMSQLGVMGDEGTIGWDSVSLQLTVGLRPERLTARGLVSALLVAAGPPGDHRHVFMQPLMLGVELESSWEAWRRVEGGPSAREPSVRVGIDLDRVIVDVRPSDLEALRRIQDSINSLTKQQENTLEEEPHVEQRNDSFTTNKRYIPIRDRKLSGSLVDSYENHYYKDDLKSGAFKIVTGGQLPMAYQVTLYGDSMSWRYPHPRTITRLLVFPIPGVDEEVKCKLEFYDPLLKKWEPHTNVTLPVTDPKEVKLHVAPPDAVFATLWRFRADSSTEQQERPFEFDITRFSPKNDPLSMDRKSESAEPRVDIVSAEQLSSALRVDSYFSPRLVPRVRVSLRFTELEIHAHNSLLNLSNKARALEGYYVSRPLMRSHRVLCVSASDTVAHALLGSPAGRLLMLDAKLSCDILECSTGTLEQMVGSTHVQVCASVPDGDAEAARVRAASEPVRVALHVPRLSTLRALAADWSAALRQYKQSADLSGEAQEVRKSSLDATEAAIETLDGRVSLWLHNTCASSLRVGQEGCDEIVPLGPGARLAYRWPSPNAPFKLRLALAGPTADWHWSSSIPFSAGESRVRLQDAGALCGGEGPSAGVYVHTSIEDTGGRRTLRLSGRLVLANVLRRPLHYKVRAKNANVKAWSSLCSGELDAETVSQSVLCGADCDMVLKIRFTSQDTGWSGDIPLRECPKENVPWLVKVPSDGDIAYVSVWCRVVRARSDGRVLAAVWPLYVLHSHLPLDTDVRISTQTEVSSEETGETQRPAPLIQTTPGRGACSHLLAPGTTAARHLLSFQYKDIDHPVTDDAIPLHYGVTDTSVFDKRAPVNNISEVIEDIRGWFERSGQEAASDWPYSVVASHWPGEWNPALVQPRCDVTVRYGAVRAGGGCSLEIQLRPVALLCNAARMALTLRAHDAAPLCRLEPGAAISAPSALLQKPFFMSIELGRETFVSGQLQVWEEEPGRYGAPPSGCVALDHPAPFLIHCSNKVAFLTLHYEIKEEINVLGVTSTFVLINRLDTKILVSQIAVPTSNTSNIVLQPNTLKSVNPTKEGSLHGEALQRFWVMERWRGGDPSELRAFACLALPCTDDTLPAFAPVPVRLAAAPVRRAIALRDRTGRSIPVVVVQQKHEGRWLITVAPDPCPQFVVQNCTSHKLAVAQLAHQPSEPLAQPTQTVPECLGAEWIFKVEAGAVVHYSTPAHSARFPPPPNATPVTDTIPFLTIGKADDEGALKWSGGVAAAGGEQLLQLPDGITIKLRVRPYPHSSLLELRDVDENDISASVIRRRLEGSFMDMDSASSSTQDLDRAGGSHVYYNIHKNNDTVPLIKASTSAISPEITQAKASTSVLGSQVKVQNRKVSILSRETVNKTTTLFECGVPSNMDGEESAENFDKNNDTVPLIKASTSAISPEITQAKASTSVLGSQVKVQNRKVSILPPETVNETTNLLESGVPSNMDGDESAENFVYGPKAESWATVDGSVLILTNPEVTSTQINVSLPDITDPEWNDSGWSSIEHLRCVIGGIAIEMAATPDVSPLFALHVDRAAVLLQSDNKGMTAMLSIADVQVDNLQYESGQYDFAVVASTRAEQLTGDAWPPLWSVFSACDAFATREQEARLLVRARYDTWTIIAESYKELTEVEVRLGPLALYVEDGYVGALARLARSALPAPAAAPAVAGAVAEARALQRPLRLRSLHLHPLDLTLTLHTAVRMYIALDQSPLSLGAFQLKDMVTCAERLTHALTVHYLSAAILGAGWVVGGLELLGAPGALAARVGGARGGVRGVAAAAAAALLRSLSAWAGSLARNLDLLAGDDEHARRAAAARRRHPDTFVQGLAAGITNFGINILGAVGGLAHHPLVGVAVGEVESGATALRRGLLGALTKPLSATADLVAFAGHGLLRQTGWDPVPQWRTPGAGLEGHGGGWRRDCVRWSFRLAELTALAGFDVLLDGAPLRLLLTHKFLMVTDPESERIVEMIDLRFCTLMPCKGSTVELVVTQRRQKAVSESRAVDEDDEYQISAAAMARVARYTGADGGAAPAPSEARVLALMPPPRRAAALLAALSVAVHSVSEDHLRLL